MGGAPTLGELGIGESGGPQLPEDFHVAHRLDRYRAGRRMDFESATTDVIASTIAEEIGRDVDYRPVETGGARRAAQRIAELLN